MDNSTSTPLISFILTCYNTPIEMICTCIDSILALSLRPSEREIIVVDDGSVTSPINDLMQYKHDILYIYKVNGGVSTARNTGLQMARGTFIQFIDADDYLICNNYEHCLDLIRFSNTDIVAFDFTRQKDNSPNYNDSPAVSGAAFMRDNNLHGSVCCMIFRHSILGKLQFTPGIQFGEDEEFTPQLVLRAGNMVKSNTKAYFYRTSPTSITAKINKTTFNKKRTDNETVLFHLNSLSQTLPPEESIAMKRRVAQLTMDYLYNIIVDTQSETELKMSIERLRQHNLYPLPDKKYSVKYTWFRRIINSKLGFKILLLTLPLLKREP